MSRHYTGRRRSLRLRLPVVQNRPGDNRVEGFARGHIASDFECADGLQLVVTVSR